MKFKEYVKAGRKDLAQKYYYNTLALKTAAKALWASQPEWN